MYAKMIWDEGGEVYVLNPYLAVAADSQTLYGVLAG